MRLVLAPSVVISLEVIAQKHESNPLRFELGLLAKASYQGHATSQNEGFQRRAHNKSAEHIVIKGFNKFKIAFFLAPYMSQPIIDQNVVSYSNVFTI